MQHDRTLLLRRALLANASFSSLCGLTLLAAGGALAEPLGIPALALRLVGLGLLPFALALWRNARRAEVDRAETWLAVGLDLAWVAGSAALVLGELWPLRPAAVWTVVGVADVVLACALLQTLGLQRAAAAPPVSAAAGSGPAS